VRRQASVRLGQHPQHARVEKDVGQLRVSAAAGAAAARGGRVGGRTPAEEAERAGTVRRLILNSLTLNELLVES